MVKTKSGNRQPREQRYIYLLGPVSSWFMPNSIDIWTQTCEVKGDNSVLSLFVYGSIGSFCYGEIHSRTNKYAELSNSDMSKCGIVNRMVDIKDDNSRVSCIRFLKPSLYPVVIALTESGSLLVHDCMKNESLLHFRKSEILTKYLGLTNSESNYNGDQQPKRYKSGVTQQINSCTWPNAENVFLGISMIKDKTCFILWLKLKDNLIVSSQKIDLDLQHYASPICMIDSKMLDNNVCIIAIAMDDGLITVISFDLDKGQTKRNIKLARHNDQICSMSLFAGNQKKFPLGLLTTVSRDGLMLIWDIENEFYFADYLALNESSNNRGSSSRINWFAVSFVCPSWSKQVYIAISNSESGITLLELPENARSKIRLKDHKSSNTGVNKHMKNTDTLNLKHSALIFNIEYDCATDTILSSSLDGNHILWTVRKSTSAIKQASLSVEVKPQFLIPAMLNNSRAHMMRSSPIREDLICLTLGKAGLKFYNMSANVTHCKFDMSHSCSLIARKITKASVSPTSVAWHPNHEYRLAIGSLEGKVFRADITPRQATLMESEPKQLPSKLSQPVDQPMNADVIFDVDYTPSDRNNHLSLCNHEQKSPKTDGIYSLCWGPNPASPQDLSKFAIYAVGSITHRLFIYTSRENSDKLTNYLDEFQDVSLAEALDRASEVAWKPTMDFMALGTIDGKILIVSYLDESHEGRSNHKLFRRVATIEGPFGSGFIQCLAWHPTTDQDDQHYNYLAASSNESPAYVFNLRESFLVANVKSQLKLDANVNHNHGGDDGEQNKQTDCMATVLAAYVNKLDAHQKAITDIAWNPHEPDQLATSSFDRLCLVWSIDNSLLEARLLSRFAASDRLFTLEWSLVDEDLIFTSGHDSTIWAWRPTENRVKAND